MSRANGQDQSALDRLVAASEPAVLRERLKGLPLAHLAGFGAALSDRMLEAIGHLVTPEVLRVFNRAVDAAWTAASNHTAERDLDVEALTAEITEAMDPYGDADSDTPVVDLHAVLYGTLRFLQGDTEAGLSNAIGHFSFPVDRLVWVAWCDRLGDGKPALVNLETLKEFPFYAVQTPEIALERQYLSWAADWAERHAADGTALTRDLARKECPLPPPQWQSRIDERFRRPVR